MSMLSINKIESGAFIHTDSIDGEFFLGRFSFKQELNKAFLVEAYGAKRREYLITDISVYDFGGSEEIFTNFTDLINRLVELNYTGIDTNEIQNFLSNQIGDYPDAPLPLLDTDELIVNRAGTWYKVDKSELGVGGSSDIVLNFISVNDNAVNTTERVAGLGSIGILHANESVTKSGSLLTGPYYMQAQNIIKTGVFKRLRFRYFPDGASGSFTMRIYAFQQSSGATTISNCRLLFEQVFTTTSAFTEQVKEFLTADFLDSVATDNEFIAITFQQSGGSGVTIKLSNLTIIYG